MYLDITFTTSIIAIFICIIIITLPFVLFIFIFLSLIFSIFVSVICYFILLLRLYYRENADSLLI